MNTNRSAETEPITQGMEVINLDDTAKTQGADEDKIVPFSFHWFHIDFNYCLLQYQNINYVLWMVVIEQVPETTEEVRQRTLREAAAEKAGEVIEYTKATVRTN